jgi:cystathionine gamma-synthase
MKPETLAVHAARSPDPVSGAVAPPINLSTTFERATDGGYPRGFQYGRTDNPGRQALEHAIAPLECYHGTGKQLKEVVARGGVTVSFVETGDLDAMAAAWTDSTRMLWIETPSNPRLLITDIAAAAGLAHARGGMLVCDSTFATPILQRPLDLGADIVMHSTTKFLAGHSDVIGGALVLRESGAVLEKLRDYQVHAGAVPSPFDCWLTRRSMMTLPQRVRAQSDSALAVAHFLETQAAIERVYYPGLQGHPGHGIAARQMSGFGSMISVIVRGSAADAFAVAGRVRLFTRATSLGSVESLIEHRASMEGPGTATPANLLRLSIGLEHPDDLIADLAQALV